jgi:N-carbamoyl-L-amino-acid hydrolase
MLSSHNWLRVNANRLKEDFIQLAKIGATSQGGVNRPAFSQTHLAARAWLRERIHAANLSLLVDGAGNHSALLSGNQTDTPVFLIGSHLDSVPDGGRYDGALGALAALEVLRTIQDAGLCLPFQLEAIDFSDEEGALIGLLGSRALAGLLTSQELLTPRGGRQNLLDALARAGLTEESALSARRDPGGIAGYLELHIEQGPLLIQQGAQIGVVTAIVGISSFRVTFHGRARHAGTTPMSARLDASLGASAFILAVRELILDEYPACVANVGQMQLYPGAYNVVPAKAILALECRAADEPTQLHLEAALSRLAQAQADRFGLAVEIEFQGRHLPQLMSLHFQQAIARAVQELSLKQIELTSGAGHDAQSLASCCPCGMIFVPSVDGISHAPDEHTPWEDCLNGANVLLHSLLHLAQ